MKPLRYTTLSLCLLWTSVFSAKGELSYFFQWDSIPTPAATANEFLLQGITRNGDTGENFDHIYVDVYKILSDGSVEVVRTDRFPGGEFEVWLRKDERYMLMMNYNNTAFLEGLLNPSDAAIVDGVLSQVFILDEYRPDLRTDNSGDQKEEADIDLTNDFIPEDRTPEPVYTSLSEDTSQKNVGVSAKANNRSTLPSAAFEEPKPVEVQTENKRDEEMNTPAESVSFKEGSSLGTFYLTGSTSFRSEATHLSTPILRFSAGNAVELLEKTDKFWWKVRFKGKIGWVKAAKLQKDMF